MRVYGNHLDNGSQSQKPLVEPLWGRSFSWIVKFIVYQFMLLWSMVRTIICRQTRCTKVSTYEFCLIYVLAWPSSFLKYCHNANVVGWQHCLPPYQLESKLIRWKFWITCSICRKESSDFLAVTSWHFWEKNERCESIILKISSHLLR